MMCIESLFTGRSAGRRGARGSAVRQVPLGVMFAAVVMIGAGYAAPSVAQDGWNPFAESVAATPSRQKSPAPNIIPQDSAGERPFLPPMSGSDPRAGLDHGPAWRNDGPPPAGAAPADAVTGGSSAPTYESDKVQTTDLAPLDAPTQPESGARQVSVAPHDRAGGLDAQAMSRLLVDLQLPYRSPATTALFLRLVSGPDAALVGEGPEQAGVKAVALYRAGRIAEAATVLPASVELREPGLSLWAMRIALANAKRPEACRLAGMLVRGQGDAASTAKSPRAEALAINGYCAAADGRPAAAGLTAGLLREGGVAPAETVAALEAVALGEPVRLEGAKQVRVIDWRLAEIGGKGHGGIKVEVAAPATLFAMVGSAVADPSLGLAAAEAAARLNVIDAEGLAAAYRKASFTAGELEVALSARIEPARRRALLFKAAETERTPSRKTRLVRAALDEARREGLYVQIAAALAPAVEQVRPVQELGWFAETAVECLLAAGRFELARTWIRAASNLELSAEPTNGLEHWLALADIADLGLRPQLRGAGLAALEQVALRGRFGPEALHRLATVLDALDYQVPFQLWDAASRAPQPAAGHLPPTGVLAELRDAAKRRDIATTILATIRTLGPSGAEGAHMISLGDAIRFLKRAGLEREARSVALEAMFPLWPRAKNS